MREDNRVTIREWKGLLAYFLNSITIREYMENSIDYTDGPDGTHKHRRVVQCK